MKRLIVQQGRTCCVWRRQRKVTVFTQALPIGMRQISIIPITPSVPRCTPQLMRQTGPCQPCTSHIRWGTMQRQSASGTAANLKIRNLHRGDREGARKGTSPGGDPEQRRMLAPHHSRRRGITLGKNWEKLQEGSKVIQLIFCIAKTQTTGDEFLY